MLCCRKLLLDETEGPPLFRLPSMSGRGGDAFSRSAEADEVGGWMGGGMGGVSAVFDAMLLYADSLPLSTPFTALPIPLNHPHPPTHPPIHWQVLGAGGTEAAVVGLLEPGVLPFQR